MSKETTFKYNKAIDKYDPDGICMALYRPKLLPITGSSKRHCWIHATNLLRAYAGMPPHEVDSRLPPLLHRDKANAEYRRLGLNSVIMENIKTDGDPEQHLVDCWTHGIKAILHFHGPIMASFMQTPSVDANHVMIIAGVEENKTSGEAYLYLHSPDMPFLPDKAESDNHFLFLKLALAGPDTVEPIQLVKLNTDNTLTNSSTAKLPTDFNYSMIIKSFAFLPFNQPEDIFAQMFFSAYRSGKQQPEFSCMKATGDCTRATAATHSFARQYQVTVMQLLLAR